MTLFRRLTLPEQVAGGLYLHSMLGRREPLEQSWAEVTRLRITQIVCLAPGDEVGVKSPDYAAAIAAGKVPCQIRHFPIADFQGPTDLEGFWLIARETADALRGGENAPVHCGAGIGRTGTFAIAVLLALGVPPEEAEHMVRAGGSSPEVPSQQEAVREIANRILPGMPGAFADRLLNWSPPEPFIEGSLGGIPRGPGVYRIRAFSEHGGPLAIARLGGIDEDGLLHIGKATNLQQRIRRFLRAARKEKAPHHAGREYSKWEFWRRIPLERLRFDYCVAAEPKREALMLERWLHEEYRRRFLDRPPLDGTSGQDFSADEAQGWCSNNHASLS